MSFPLNASTRLLYKHGDVDDVCVDKSVLVIWTEAVLGVNSLQLI